MPTNSKERGFFSVAISETPAELYLILYKATNSMFTKHRTQVAEIEAEYVRLRELPKWRDLQLPYIIFYFGSRTDAVYTAGPFLSLGITQLWHG